MIKVGAFIGWGIVLVGCIVVAAKQLFFAGQFDRELVQRCVWIAAVAAVTMYAIISEEFS